MKKTLIMLLMTFALLINQTTTKAALPPGTIYYANLNQMQKGFDYLGTNLVVPKEDPFDNDQYFISYQVTNNSRFSYKKPMNIEPNIYLQAKQDGPFSRIQIEYNLTEYNVSFNQYSVYDNNNESYTLYLKNDEGQRVYFNFYYTNDLDMSEVLRIQNQFLASVDALYVGDMII